MRGWIRNRPDGSVEAMLEGEATAVERLLDWCRRGPPFADVEAVDVTPEPPAGEFADFTIRR